MVPSLIRNPLLWISLSNYRSSRVLGPILEVCSAAVALLLMSDTLAYTTGHQRSFSCPTAQSFSVADASRGDVSNDWRSDAGSERSDYSQQSHTSLRQRPSLRSSLFSSTYSRFKKSMSNFGSPSIADSNEDLYSTPATSAHSRSSSCSTTNTKPSTELRRTPSAGYRHNLLQEAISCYLLTLHLNGSSSTPEISEEQTPERLSRDEEETVEGELTGKPLKRRLSFDLLSKEKTLKESREEQEAKAEAELWRSGSFGKKVLFSPTIRKSLSQPLRSEDISPSTTVKSDPFSR